jgi:hypothetical protein
LFKLGLIMSFSLLNDCRLESSGAGNVTLLHAFTYNGVNYDVEIIDPELPGNLDPTMLVSRVGAVWRQVAESFGPNELAQTEITYNGRETWVHPGTSRDSKHGSEIPFNLDAFVKEASTGESFAPVYAPNRNLTAHGAVSYFFDRALRPHYVSLPASEAKYVPQRAGSDSSSAHAMPSALVDFGPTPPTSPTPHRPSHFTFDDEHPTPSPMHRHDRPGPATVELLDDEADSVQGTSPTHGQAACAGISADHLAAMPVHSPDKRFTRLNAFEQSQAHPMRAVSDLDDSVQGVPMAQTTMADLFQKAVRAKFQLHLTEQNK